MFSLPKQIVILWVSSILYLIQNEEKSKGYYGNNISFIIGRNERSLFLVCLFNDVKKIK